MSKKSVFDLAVLILLLFVFSSCAEGPDIAEPDNNSGYIGEDVPSSFYAFSQTSLWRVKIVENPEIDPNSDLMIQNLIDVMENELGYDPVLRVNYKNWTSPIHFIDSDKCQKINIETDGNGFHESVDPDGDGIAENIPIPDNVWQDPSEDGHMILIDNSKRIAWEFSRFKKLGQGEFITSTLSIWDLEGNGYLPPFSGNNWWRAGSTGSGTPMIGGIVTYTEFKNGIIEHALAISTPINRKKASHSDSWTHELCSPPAARTDGYGIGVEYIPEGARIQLNPDLDLDALGLTDDSKIFARALQEYGAYVWGNAHGFNIRLQNLGSDGSRWENNTNLNFEKLPLHEFRVLKCNITTKP